MEIMKKKEFGKYEKYALVTGAASGMGRLYTIRLATMGYNVIPVDINKEGLDQTCSMAKDAVMALEGLDTDARGRFRMLPLVQDLSLREAAEQVYQKTEAEGCKVEVLVNNAGIMYCKGIAETAERKLELIMAVHMTTPLMLCRKYVNGMKERGCGYILNISSLAAWMSWPGIGMYGNTKRFVKDYSRELRLECQKTGVSVTNAYFGALDTPLVPLRDDLRKLARGLTVMIRPEKAVSRALRATFNRRRGVMPGLVNWIFLPFIIILPDCLLGWIYRKVKKYL